MTVDYQRLVEGLSAAAEMTVTDRAGLAAIDVLVAAVREATGAAGATFTEYGPEGGRVVAAAGVMDFALGQPIAREYVDAGAKGRPAAWIGKVDDLPVHLAEPLLARQVGALAGYPVWTAGRTVGAFHLFLSDLSPSDLVPDADTGVWPQLQQALGVVVAAAAHAYVRGQTPPTIVSVEEDDRALFLAVAGHELRTPVTVVKGYASMLADRWDSLDEASRRDAARVLTQRSDELARLVDRILGASAGDSAAGWLVRTVPFDPIEALLRATGELPMELRRCLRLELPNSLPPATGDPAILASIVAELVTNSVRYTPTGCVRGGSVHPDGVEIFAGADAQTVFIRVCDRGVGIDPADVERAFERFWRAGRERNGRGGVGLGLYLVRRLVERQNGWVSLRPREGGGTVAEVRLPRADIPISPPSPPAG